MDEKNSQELDLENIIKEFGNDTGSKEAPEQSEEEALLEQTQRLPDVKEIAAAVAEAEPEPEMPVDLEQTRRMEPVQAQAWVSATTAETIRLDGLKETLAENAPKEVAGAVRIHETDVNMEQTIRSEPFSAKWEPEYEQPMGEYVPPQPIAFHPRSRLRELKRKLVAGPEKRFYDLSEKGVGKLQAAIFLSLLVVLISAASTVMYAMGLVQENRMRLMVFGQFLSLLVSALLGSHQMIEGIADLGKKRFTLNTLLVVTFLFCCADGVLCLRQLRVPCCAAFSLEVTMSLWSTYHRRSTEMAQLDTMRKAIRLDGLAAYPEYFDGKKGFLRVEGQVEDFMDNYAQIAKPEKRLNVFALVAMIAAIGIGAAVGVMRSMTGEILQGISTGVQVTAISLLAALPATAHISQSRPTWILERRLHKLGTVLCGWQGVEGLSGKAVFPLRFNDLYPAGSVRMNGMKFFGNREPEEVVSYATAVISANDCGLAELFYQVLDSHNGRHYDAKELQYYENGGVRGLVENEVVLVGSAAFFKEMEITVPDSAKVSYGIYVAIAGELCALFAVSYEKTKSAVAGLSTLTSYGKLYCVLTSSDFMVTHSFLKSKFGIRKKKRFLLPEQEVRGELREKTPEPGEPALLLTTTSGLASYAYGVTGARVLKSTCRMGTALHVAGGALGLIMMGLLVALGALQLLTPVNMFLYHLVWMIPGFLISEWTRSI